MPALNATTPSRVLEDTPARVAVSFLTQQSSRSVLATVSAQTTATLSLDLSIATTSVTVSVGAVSALASPGSLQLSGLSSDVSSALSLLTYTAPPDYYGSDVITIVVRSVTSPSCM